MVQIACLVGADTPVRPYLPNVTGKREGRFYLLPGRPPNRSGAAP